VAVLTPVGRTVRGPAMRRHPLLVSLALLLGLTGRPAAAELPKVAQVELQPLAAQVQRLVEALEYLGAPLSAADGQALKTAAGDPAKGVGTIQDVLDAHCLAGVTIQSADKLEARPGPAQAALAEQGWRVFLVKVSNPSGVAQVGLQADSPN